VPTGGGRTFTPHTAVSRGRRKQGVRNRVVPREDVEEEEEEERGKKKEERGRGPGWMENFR
jgi:hypothetical protein